MNFQPLHTKKKQNKQTNVMEEEERCEDHDQIYDIVEDNRLWRLRGNKKQPKRRKTVTQMTTV